MNYGTIPRRVVEALDRFPSPRAMQRRTGSGWEPIASAEVLRRIAGLAAALEKLGVQPGDRVGLFAPNCPEWHFVDLAVQGLGGADVPVYFRESDDRLAYILNHAGTKVLYVAGAEQARRIVGLRGRLPKVRHVIVGGAAAETPREFLRDEDLTAPAGAAEIEAYRRRLPGLAEDALATIIYTSGTTGEPKGVMLTQHNLSSNVTDSVSAYNFSGGDLGLSFLPLSHVFERIADYNYLVAGVSVAYVENMDRLVEALHEVRPTVFAAVPRVFEKFYAGLMERGQSLKGFQAWLFRWAMETARKAMPWRAYGKPVPFGARLEWRLANLIAYPRIRAALGGRFRQAVSGGAPLSTDLAEFFWSVGISVYQGYGLTETSPVVSANRPGQNKVGTVGRPIPNVEVRIALDGEILVRGPCVMAGYYQKPEETRAVLSPDGWLSTGDIGHLDPDGYLVITDRKKDLFKTAAGKFVAPQPIENRLKSSPYIANAAVVGDRRKFVSVLIVPNFAAVEAKARAEGIAFGSRNELVGLAWLRSLIEREVARLTESFAQYERPKRFALLAEDFTFDNGQLTFTLKLKRRIIDRRYHDVIESLYADVAEPHPAEAE